MKGIIYKYTFPDGKVYIGQTRNPEKRKHDHIDPKIGPVNKGFWEAYQRFGTYEYQVIREIESDNEDELIDLLNRYESGYIYQYKADDPKYGYNLVSYATVVTETEKILRRLHKSIQNDFFNNEMQILESASEKIWRTKKPLTDKEKFLLTEAYPDSIWMDYLKDFDFINPINNAITEQTAFYLDEHIGFLRNEIWKYSQYAADLFIMEKRKQIIEEVQLSRTIVQLDKDGNVIKEYSSILEICQAFNVPRGDNVRNVLNGKQKTAYGFLWKYKKDLFSKGTLSESDGEERQSASELDADNNR